MKKRKLSPAESSAQHLANLMGTSVAGFVPVSTSGASLPVLDLDVELFKRNNVAIASLVILSSLVKGDQEQREECLRRTRVEYFNEKSLDRFLFETIVEYHRATGQVPVQDVRARILEYGPQVWGEASDERELTGHYFMWAQIVSFSPTTAQVERAIELRKMWAARNGLITEDGGKT